MMTPAGWEGISWAAGGFFAAKLGCRRGRDEKNEGECLVVLGIICIFAARFVRVAAIDGCDETREQPRTAADETQRGRPGMAADEMQRGQARMAAIWIMKTNER